MSSSISPEWVPKLRHHHWEDPLPKSAHRMTLWEGRPDPKHLSSWAGSHRSCTTNTSTRLVPLLFPRADLGWTSLDKALQCRRTYPSLAFPCLFSCPPSVNISALQTIWLASDQPLLISLLRFSPVFLLTGWDVVRFLSNVCTFYHFRIISLGINYVYLILPSLCLFIAYKCIFP